MAIYNLLISSANRPPQYSSAIVVLLSWIDTTLLCFVEVVSIFFPFFPNSRDNCRLQTADVKFLRACSFLFMRFRPGAEFLGQIRLGRGLRKRFSNKGVGGVYPVGFAHCMARFMTGRTLDLFLCLCCNTPQCGFIIGYILTVHISWMM